MDVHEILAENCRRLGKKKGLLTDESIADAAGVAQSTVSSAFALKRSPTLNTLVKIADGLDVPVWRLLKP
ncbi:MAG: helix-turn-helix transcriptional regulator [Pseudomonadota bacterium]